MIKAPYTIAELDLMALIFYKESRSNFSIRQKIKARPADQLTLIFNHIDTNLKDILIGHPNILEAQIQQIEPLVTSAKANYKIANPLSKDRQINKWFKDEIFKIFNYDYDHNSFTKRNNGLLSYKHAQRLNLTTCPYCNAQFTFTIKKNTYKTRPHFDHFFSKSKYPYLALSFYNLIPACYICNSNLKGSKPFLFSTHLHPFIDSIEGLYKFKTNITSVDFLVNKKDFTIKPHPNPLANNANKIRANNNIIDFAIEDRYNNHKDYAGEVITKTYIYNHSAIKELLEDYEVSAGVKLFKSEGEVIELILGNYINANKLHKRILSKLTKDIADEFGLNL